MTNINFLSNLVVKNEDNHVPAAEKNEVNCAPADAKRLQIAGGGASRHEALIVAEQFSQSCVLRSEGAQHRVLQSEGARYNVLQSEGTQKERSGRTMYKAQKENTHGAELFGYHGAFIPDGHPTADRQSCMTPVGDQRGVKRQNDHELPLTYPLFAPYLPLTYTSFDTRSSVSRQSDVATRVWKYAACVVMVLVMSIGQMWATDFTVTLDQFRTKPISGLVKIDNSNLSVSSGALQLSSGNKDFTVYTTNSDYKIKKIVFTCDKAVIKYSGDAISDKTFQPATPGTSFTLNLTASGGTAKITQMVVTLTTATSETLESLVATALSDNTYTTSSSVITITTVGGSHTSTSGQEQIKLDKSKSERSLTISTPVGKNLKFIAFNYYDAIFSKAITASTGTYTAATYTWAPGETPTNTVTLTFNTENSEGAKIRRIFVGYEAAGGGCGSTAQAALTLSSSNGTICGTGTATFTVSGGSGTGALSVSSSDPSKATASISGTTVTVTGVAAGSATITVTKACDATYAEKTATYAVTVAAVPSASAGEDKTTEPGTGVALAATAAASGCTGAWTIVSGPNTATSQLSSTTSATATFTPTVAGTYTLRWTVTNSTSGCLAHDDMTVTAATCAISSCGNATLTYPIYTTEATTTSNLVSGASLTSGTGITVGATSFEGIGVNTATTNNVAATNTCFPSKFTMSGKLEQYKGTEYSSSKYLQFAFTVNSGYTFTPCDIQFVVQPVSAAMNFRWEVTDGTNVYGYGTGSAGRGDPNGATVLTGLSSTAEMAAGTFYIRFYPYSNTDGNTFRIGKNVILKGTTAEVTPSCTAPASVTVTPTNTTGWRYSTGETIDLTCTATGGTGTKTYQWQKYIGSTWTDINTATNASAGTAHLQIANCTSSDGGNYRCVVSTGATCSLESDGYWIRVFTLDGNYSGSGAWVKNSIVWTGEYTGVATVNLNASSTYMFKVTDNDGKWFGYTANNFIIQPQARDCGTGNSDIRLFTGPAGDYTFTINIQHAAEGSPYVNISVAYPEVSHPNSGYMYITKWWDCYIHYWEGENNALTTWGSDPKINSDRYVEICGTNYWYFPVIATYNKFIAKDATGDAGNTTGDQVSTANGGKYITNDGSWGWHDFSTYSISFDAGGGTGTMSAIEGICPNSNQAITANAFEKTGHTFNCWHADKAVKVGGSAVAIGGDIAGGATLQEINNDITLTAQWTAKTTTITINANTANHGSTAPSPITATYGSALPSFTAAAGASGYSLTGYFTAATSGTKVINADGTLVASTDYADGSGKWKYETSTLTLYPQYEEEVDDCYSEVAKVTLTGKSSAPTCTGSYNPSGAVSGLQDGNATGYYKLGGKPSYVKLQLGGGNTFQAGDSIILEIRAGDLDPATGSGSQSSTPVRLFTNEGTTAFYTSSALTANTLHTVRIKVTADMISAGLSNTVYIYRTTDDASPRYSQNHQVKSIAVKHCIPSCSTPDAPTSPTNGATTSNSQAVSWTDESSDKWDVYVSTSSTTPAGGVTPTASGLTAKTYTFTGLTASTAYYWWVRSVCDDTHKSSWFAGSSFTTSAAPAGLTAIEENTLYQPLNMLCTGMSPLPSGDTYFTDDAYSTDNRFYYDVSSGNGPKAHTISEVTLGSGQAYEATFASEMWVKGTSTVTDGIPSAPSIKFLTPSTSGTLYLYIENGSCPVKFKKEDGTASNITGLTQVVSGKIYSTTVEANSVYYIYGNGGSNTGVYGLKLITCTTPAAPTAFAAGSITSTGATFTITDAGDAASYDLYYSTSSTSPTAGTEATTTSTSKTKAVTGLTASTTYYAWVRSVCDASHKSAWVAGTPATFTTTAAPSTYNVTYDGNGKTSGSVPTDATAYEEGDIVTVLGNTGSLVKAGQTFLGWSTNATASSGTFYPAGYKFYMPNEAVTLYAVWGSTAEEKYYYGSITITAGALTPGSTGTKGFFTNNGGEIATSSAISLSSTPGEAGYYYESSTLTHTALNKSSNWNTSSTAKRTIRAFKFQSGSSYTLALGSKTATSIMFYGRCGSASRTMTIGGVEYESPSTKDQFFSHEYTKVGNFTGNVTITQDGDFYGILVVTVSTGAGSNHTVSFNMNGHGSAIADIENVPTGSKIGAPIPEPTATDWDFGGWYNEAGCTSAFNFASTTITADKILYAKWSNCAPTITTHPVAANYNQNGVATALTVAANNNGGGELHYQWWVKENDLPEEDGSAIPGETGTSFTPSTMLLGTSYYYCVVSNDCGNVKTNTAAVTITDDRPDPKAVWTVAEPTHGGKGFTFSVAVKKNDNTLWDGTLEASMLTLSSEAVLGDVSVDNDTKIISGTYGVKGSATSPVTFYLLLPATDTQAAKRLDYDRSFTECVGGSGDSYDIRVRKNSTHDGNYYHWANTDGWISPNISNTINSEKASSKMGASNQFDSIYNSNTQYVWVRTYHANINKVRIYADFRANDMTVSNVYKHTGYFTANDKYIVSYTAVYNGNAEATNLGDANQGYVDITLEEPMNANDIVLVKFNNAKVRPLGAVLTEARSGGSLETALVWSNSQASGTIVAKSEDELDFTITANRSGANALASLGTINYSSSVPSVATINAVTGVVHIADNIDFGSADNKETTITALLNPSGCYKRSEITYVLRVNKHVCTEAAGTIGVVDRGCAGMDLTITGYEDGATVQWYKDGSPVGTNSATYNATEPGEYHAVTTKTCAMTSTNSVVLAKPVAEATKIVDSWYIKNGRRTPDIALVQTTNATGFTVTSGGSSVTNIGGCTFELKDDGIIYLHGTQDNGDAPSGMTPGDMTITITATACSNATPLDIVLHIQAETVNPSIAFVVDGTLRKDGGTATSVLAAKTSERPIWKYLANTFALTGCNAYWSVDSKELRQYYSQFDAILITDDPNTSTNGTGGVSYVKALGTMVDVRPVLTMEAYVGKFKDGGWHVYDATPSSPNPRQVEMKLECKNHDIFKGLNPATSDNVRMTVEGGNEYWHIVMVDTTLSPYHNTTSDYEALPALQGFDATKFSNMLGVGTIFNEKLQGGVERQEEPAARMMILGIQNNAMAALTNEGKLIVKNALDYLLKTNMEDVNDCSNYFTGAEDDQWNNLANWTGDALPDFETRARILRPVVVPDGYQAVVARVDIATSGASKHVTGECNGSVTINPTGALIVGGKIRSARAPQFGIDDLMPTENSDLVVKASTTAPHNQGALIFNNTDGDTHAVVEMWNPSHWVMDGGKKKKYWSYVAVPIQEADIPNFFWNGFTYLYDETSGWIKKGDGTVLYPFQGIGASLQTGNMETFYGPLASTDSQDITLTYTADKGQGMNLIGNSWTAPIQIANFEEDDFGDAAAEVWVFNTGHTNGGHSTMADGSSGTTTAGQWQTIPIGVAGLNTYTGLKVVPAMQAFEVNTSVETTLHLDYDRLVRAGRENLNEPMRTPRRGSAAKQIEATMRVRVSGELTHTDVYLLKDARFSDAFDNGWDGHYLSGDDRSARLYALSETSKLAFLAQPEIDGTQLGFVPGRETEYMFSFFYDGDATLYLNDLKEKKSTLISEENTYSFTYEEGDEANRFLISGTPFEAPQTPTDAGQVPSDQVHGTKVLKVIYQDKVYIIRGGKIYDIVGKVVK